MAKTRRGGAAKVDWGVNEEAKAEARYEAVLKRRARHAAIVKQFQREKHVVARFE